MIIHVVSRGETLSGIARQYGTSVSRIISDNGLSSLPYPVVGQALAILLPEIIHTVSAGESIYSISQNYNISPLELMQKNPVLSDNPTLYIGQTLAITFKEEGNTPIYISGYIYPYISETTLRKNLLFASECAIFGYGFRDDGSLIIPQNEEFLIDAITGFSAKPILLLSSIGDDGTFSTQRSSLLFRDKALQNRVIDNLISEMREKGYGGIDLDFEYINQSDTDAFISFIENVAERMRPNGFTVNVDLAPKTSKNQQGILYEAHDYGAIGAISDTVLLMTYEWGYTYGPPMAVAPISAVRRVVEYATREIERDKIMLGIPNYGYNWRLPYERGTTRAENIGNEGAVLLAADVGAEIKFDEEAASPYFEYTDRGGSQHIVWFEDVRSIKAKFELLEEFNLRGAGYWNFMRPFSQNFAYVSDRFYINK